MKVILKHIHTWDAYTKGAFAAVLIAVFWGIPWGIKPALMPDLDTSWVMVLHRAFLEKWIYGKDIIWHYGPLGFLYGQFYHPGTYYYLLGYWSLLFAVFLMGLISITRNAALPPLMPAFITCITLLTDDVFFVTFSLLLWVSSFCTEKKTSWLTWLLVITVAMVSMVKITYAVMAVIVLLSIELTELGRRKIAGKYLLLYIICAALFWKLHHQSFSFLLPYLQGVFSLASGFTAMATYHRPLIYLLCYLLGAGAWVFIVEIYLWKKERHLALPAIGSLILLVWLAIKMGFIQSNDHHFLEALSIMIVLVALTKEYLWKEAPLIGKRLFIAGAGGIIAIMGWYAVIKEKDGIWEALGKEKAVITASTISTVRKNDTNHPRLSIHSRRERFEKQGEAIRKRYPLPAIDHPVDIYGYRQAILEAYTMPYRPRPVFQSYHVYTPLLAALNCQHLLSEKASDSIFFAVEPILSRFPSVEDGCSWPLLFTQYDIKGIHSGYVEMTKAASPRKLGKEILKKENVRLGEVVKVPEIQDGALWVHIDVPHRFLGWLLEKLLVSAPISIEFELESGYQRTDRLIPANLKEPGFLLSPLVDNTLHWLMLAGGEKDFLQRNRVISLKIDTSPAWKQWVRLLFGSSIEITFSKMAFPNQALSKVKHWDRYQPYALLSTGLLASETGEEQDLIDQHIMINSPKGEPRIEIRGEAKFVLPIQSDSTSIAFNYGSFHPFNYRSHRTGEVKFTLIGETEHGEEVLWEHQIPGLRETQTYADYRASLSFTKQKLVHYKRVILIVKPLQQTAENWEYIANFSIK